MKIGRWAELNSSGSLRSMSQSAWKIHNAIEKFRALRRTRYMREGCSCRNDVIVASHRTSIAFKLSLLSSHLLSSHLLSSHRFMSKSQFQKASSLLVTPESITLPGRSVLLLERPHPHPSYCLLLNWDQQTSQVIIPWLRNIFLYKLVKYDALFATLKNLKIKFISSH